MDLDWHWEEVIKKGLCKILNRWANGTSFMESVGVIRRDELPIEELKWKVASRKALIMRPEMAPPEFQEIARRAAEQKNKRNPADGPVYCIRGPDVTCLTYLGDMRNVSKAPKK